MDSYSLKNNNNNKRGMTLVSSSMLASSSSSSRLNSYSTDLADADADTGSGSGATTTTTAAGSSGLAGTKRVVSELQTGNDENKDLTSDEKKDSAAASSLAKLRTMVHEERTVHTTLKDYTTLLQSDDPTSFQNTAWRERVAQWFYDVSDYLEESRDLRLANRAVVSSSHRSAMTSAANATSDGNTCAKYRSQTDTSIKYDAKSNRDECDGATVEDDDDDFEDPPGDNRRLYQMLVEDLEEVVRCDETVSWDHRIITPHNFLQVLYKHLVQSSIVPGGSSKSSSSSSSTAAPSQSSLFDLASYLIEVSVYDLYFAQVLPSEVAFAALVMALRCDEETTARYGQASVALFIQSIQLETGIDINSPRMKAILSRLSDVYSQSQEASADTGPAGSSRFVEHHQASHDIRDEEDHSNIILMKGDIVNINDDDNNDEVGRPIIIPQDYSDVPSDLPEPARTISPSTIQLSKVCPDDDNSPPTKRARVEVNNVLT
eukprot:CAMPEP_0113482150 /NCGR_PEP_ID=MMETSP0014_2-20120614/22771_1 /TAXON_ID=2857 /ORGANISM="Nitzschia sp." /LENGTH=488 /DNA_ID=CAMNT_0000375659 /DNA_START=391 /DNA_END=1857 /DNA_ORIENTATION=+ /assembly_acc=CAM_ASM_000159